MKQYLDLVREIYENGTDSGDRTGTGTRRIPGYQMRFNLQEGFPLVTVKKTAFRLFAEEMLWFIKGNMDLRSLVEKNVHIWNDWPFESWVNSDQFHRILPKDWKHLKDTDKNFKAYFTELMNEFVDKILTDDEFSKKFGDCRPMYGYQWRHWLGVNPFTREVEEMDQLQWAIDEIKNNPNSRRIKVSAWNANQVPYMKLPACHCDFQFLVINGELHCIMNQRSCDTFLGVPFNTGQYALLTHIIANICDLKVGTLVHNLNDAHLYSNHYSQVEEMLTRTPMKLPELIIKRKFASIDDNITIDDFELVGYESHGPIKAPVSI